MKTKTTVAPAVAAPILLLMKLMLMVLSLGLMGGPARAAEPAPSSPERRVALVFDDGPEPQHGPALQALLAREGVKATFAHVGRNVQRHPAVTRAARDAGHEIVNHSYSHARIAELDAAGVQAEVSQGLAAIEAVLGARPRWYWPPYLAVDDRLRASLQQADLPLYEPHHLADSKDWDRSLDGAEIRRRATTDVRDGSVILFHEWRPETLEQLPEILSELRRQGCVFLTFSELRAALQNDPPAP